jgi:hypothetical protein
VTIAGDVAYLIGGNSAPLITVDISDPLAPAPIGSSVTLLPPGLDIVVANNIAYVAAGSFYIFDVSDPANPALLAISLDGSIIHSVRLHGTRAIVADLQDAAFGGLGGLGVYDVADPANPVLLGHEDAHQDDKDALPIGFFSYVANNTSVGLHAVDISDPTLPQVVKTYSPIYAVEDVTIHGGWIYASTVQNGLVLHALDNRGDCNDDGVVTASDLIWQINFIFKSGPPPIPLEQGDANCLDDITLADVVYLANYIFKSGTPPVCP